MGDRRLFDRTAPGPSGDILPAGGARVMALGIFYGSSVDEIGLAPAR
jgi:hypothetical protein